MTTEIERDLGRLFEAQADALVPPAISPYDLTGANVDRPRSPLRGRSGWLLAVAAAAVALVVVGLLAGGAVTPTETGLVSAADESLPEDRAVDEPSPANNGGSDNDSESTFDEPSGPDGSSLLFETSTVRLQADTIEVDTAGKTFSPNETMTVSSDPGTPNEYTTLELTWFDHGVEMRIYLYFASDGSDWWVNEVRTYDGNNPGEWLIVNDEEHFRSFLGQPFQGEVIAVGAMRMTGVELEGFLAPGACGAAPQYGIEPTASAIEGTVEAGRGYGLGVVLYDTTDCTPAPDAPVDVSFTSTDESVVVVRPTEPEATTDGYLVDLEFIAPGTAIIRIEARFRDSGDLAHSVEVPVVLR